jgi:hypothetical protein
MVFDNREDSFNIRATLPMADFAGIWAALGLNRAARLECIIEEGTNAVVQFRVESEGPRLF